MRSENPWAVIGIAAVALCAIWACTNRSESPIFRHDLRSLRFSADKTDVARNYTDISFLTDNLLLVNTATERGFRSVEPLFDEISSKLLLFDLSTGKLVKTGDFPVEKEPGSVQSTRSGRFVVLNLSGVRVCSMDLTCSAPFSTSGPLLVSPGGTRLLVGGDGQSERKVLDSNTLQELDHFPPSLGYFQLGDTLLVNGDHIVDKASGKPRQTFIWTDADPQFLSEGTLAGYAYGLNGPSKVVVRRDSHSLTEKGQPH